MNARWIAGIVCWMACAASPAAGQTVAGTVVDGASGHRLARAAVVVLDLAGTTVFAGYADSAGVFSASVPSGGVYRLEVGQLGYLAAILPELEVPDDRGVSVRVELPPSPIRIPGVDVRTSARSEAIERRSTASIPRLDRPQIEAMLPAAGMTTLLRRLPAAGLHIGERLRDPGSSIYDLCIESTRAAPTFEQTCRWPAVFVDGIRQLAPEEALRLLSPSDIASIEFLPPGLAGARYGTGAQYGVLLIETMR